MTTFLLIRHATTDAVGKRLAGRIKGVHLNEEGHLQAANLTQRLQQLPIKAIYSSPMERALETAEPLAALLQQEVQVREEFTELDFGQWTNKSIEELKTDEEFRRFNLFRSVTPPPGGELMPVAQARMVGGIQQLSQQHTNEVIVIVSHSDLIKSVVAHYAGIHLDLMQRLEIEPASVSILVVYPETARITRLNDTGVIQL
jgi:probable phosphoglycerate mutase